ncbi:MAG: toll/interleukin-1 receptor domain-containing protein [Acidimicrobiales bacterium]
MASSDPYSYDVFLSHSHADSAFAETLARDLAAAGFSVFLDRDQIRPGESIAHVIERALQSSRFVLMVMSPDYFSSQWTTQEWSFGLLRQLEEGATKLLPILYKDTPIPSSLAGLVYLDFRPPSDYRANVDRLTLDLSRLLSEAAAGSEDVAPLVGTSNSEAELPPAGSTEITELKELLARNIDLFRAGSAPDTFDSVGESDVDKRRCFVVMPFDDEDLEIVYEHFVRPTLEQECDLIVERGDDVFGSNVIVDDIGNSIRRSGLVVADLTSRNPNVFYEVGIAHTLDKRVLLMSQSMEDVPFDLRHRRILLYEYSPLGTKNLVNHLIENVKAMLAG